MGKAKTKTDKINEKKEQKPFKREINTYLRLPKEDLDILEQQAAREGLKRPLYITSILHKYVTGRYIEKAEENQEHEIKIPRQRETMNHRQYSQRAC